MIDLRSDTVTRPTPAMRQAMAAAEVGDDVFGDDPTVRRLEETAAGILGKEAGLFVPSGSMANNLAIHVWCRPGEEALMDNDAHSICYEVGAPAALSGVQTRTFRSRRGVPDVDDVTSQIHTESLHAPGTTLLILENTHNRAGGTVIPLDVHRKLAERCVERGVRIHLDGARLFNAQVASGVPARDYAACADSVSFCLSKGLGCPVGSLLCGPRDFIDRARRARKRFGGGMRQVGVLAACGLIALETGIDRLAEDHENARRLATGLRESTEVSPADDVIETNMVYVRTPGPAGALVEALSGAGVLCLATGPRSIRFVTHRDVSRDVIDRAVSIIARVARLPA